MEVLFRDQPRGRGFTITEMLIVVAVAGVLVAVAAPNLASLYINNKLDTAANEFMAALNFARSEAIRRGVDVSVRSASYPSQNWTQGWQVRTVASGEVLRESQRVAEPLTLYSSFGTVLDVVFSATGAHTKVGADRVFVLCHGTDTRFRSRAVMVSDSGGAIRLAPIVDGRPMKSAGVSITNCLNP